MWSPRPALLAVAAALVVPLAATGPAPAAPPVPTLVGISAARVGDVDRVAFEFAGGLPRVRARYVDELVGDASGLPVRIAGRAVLRLRFSPADAHDADAEFPPHGAGLVVGVGCGGAGAKGRDGPRSTPCTSPAGRRAKGMNSGSGKRGRKVGFNLPAREVPDGVPRRHPRGSVKRFLPCPGAHTEARSRPGTRDSGAAGHDTTAPALRTRALAGG